MSLSMRGGQGLDFAGRVIYNFNPIEKSMTLTIEEFKSLINNFSYGHPQRLAFLLMGCFGLRSIEVCRLTLDMFSEGCRFLIYPIAKPKVKTYNTGTRSITVKTRKVELYDNLRNEIYSYIEKNYHLFENREIFCFSKDSLRRYVSGLRNKASKGLIDCPVLCNLLLDQECVRYGFGLNVQPAYRFSLHSFRRFYLTFQYNVSFDRDVVLTQLDIGHDLKETTMCYVKRPGDIGLTPGLIKKKVGFDQVFYGKDQKTLDDFS